MSNGASGANHLADATSPYLLQHADNPVEWYPWGHEALERARRDNRPILLSIGYSACHWCHVMAHESFEDPRTAELMNREFINIKVDREERPDLDRIYQTAHQLLSGRPGGWPLTVFLTPDQRPFFSGTYFPGEPRHGLPAFRDLLSQIAAAFREQGEAITEQNRALQDALERVNAGPTPQEPAPDLPQSARSALQGEFDADFGGFGEAPKFPQPTVLRRLMRDYAAGARAGRPDREALHMACSTLRRMALGGIYDQVGGGFARYSVDRYWMIPHFEKMLYDNGQLLGLYADAWQATGDELYRRVALETAEWVHREMTHPEGAFYASLDADSEGGEGAYYLWTPQEVQSLLSEEEATLVTHRFGLNERANFEGRWHLHVHATFSWLAKRMGRSRSEVVALWEQARRKLLAARQTRPAPHRDDKVLTSWNALMVAGLARAARLLEAPELSERAAAALGFLKRELWHEGRLLASWRDGRATLPAYLDDHAFLLAALLEQLQTRWEDDLLTWAREVADLLLTHFEDSERGGFFFTADDHEALIQRPRVFSDDACPSGNSVAAWALQRLGHLLGEPRYLRAAERTLYAAAGAAEQVPQAHCGILEALEEHRLPPETVIVRPAGNSAAWRTLLGKRFRPDRQAFVLEGDEAGRALGELAPPQPGATLCRGGQCLAPVDTPEALADQLRSGD
ncbi:MAG: thioredoxin domain-containing protein [Ectothiorhodospiraceae bacterium]|jgi:hypothetical protein